MTHHIFKYDKNNDCHQNLTFLYHWPYLGCFLLLVHGLTENIEFCILVLDVYCIFHVIGQNCG